MILPGPFSILYYTVVLPAAIVNTVTSILIYLAFSYSKKAIVSNKQEMNI